MSQFESKKSNRGRPLDRNGVITRQKIIDGARQLFARQSYSFVSNKMIAESSGLTSSALYNYFSSKTEIYRTVLEETEDLVADYYLKAIEGVDSPLQAISMMIECNGKLHRERPELPRMLSMANIDVANLGSNLIAQQKNRGKIQEILRDLIVKAQKKGEICDQLPVHNIEMTIIAAATGVSLLGLQLDVEEHTQNLTTLRKLIDGSLIKSAN